MCLKSSYEVLSLLEDLIDRRNRCYSFMGFFFFKFQTIRQLQYNCMKKSLLGSVSDDGCTYLWDTNSKRLLHSFSCVHKAPATGLVFSPLNDMLLLSAGLDKAIVCYDVRSKQ